MIRSEKAFVSVIVISVTESIDNMWLENVIEYDIAPMLREYWFDNDKKFKEETDKLLSLIK